MFKKNKKEEVIEATKEQPSENNNSINLVERYQKYGYYQADMINIMLELSHKMDTLIELMKKAVE